MTPIWFDGDVPHIATRRRTLACGLDVVTHHDPDIPTVTASMNYRVGSSDDRSPRTGFAHLFEHLFKCSPARLGGHHYDVLRRAGASDANASTSADRTRYHETVPANQLDLALWLESSRMAFFLEDFDPETLVTQKSVVRSERRQRYEDVAYGAERFAVAAAMWPEGHPLRHMTIGLHDDIQAATVDDVAAFYRTWYVPANATLVVAGDLGESDAVVDDAVDRYFGSFPTSTRPARTVPAEPSPVIACHDIVDDKFAALSRIHRVWRGPRPYTDDEPALDLLAAAWAATGTGALWRRLVYETQLAQRVSASCSSTRIGGEFEVVVDLRTGADPAKVRAILDEELALILANRARDLDAQLHRVVTRREAAVVWSLSSPSKRVSSLQRFVLYLETPDGFGYDLARHRAADDAQVVCAAAQRWLAGPCAEIETRVSAR